MKLSKVVNHLKTIAQRIREALDLRGMKQSDLVSATGIGKSSISTYLTGEYEPKQRNIYKIAKALDVSESWLMGYDVPMNPSSKSINELSLPQEALEIADLYLKLDDLDRAEIKGEIKGMLKNPKYKPKNKEVV